MVRASRPELRTRSDLRDFALAGLRSVIAVRPTIDTPLRLSPVAGGVKIGPMDAGRVKVKPSAALADRFAVAVLVLPLALAIAVTAIAASERSCPIPGWASFTLFPLVQILYVCGGLASILLAAFARRKRAVAGGVAAVLVCCPGSVALSLLALFSMSGCGWL
jgi:hypothetical protein